MGSAGHSDKSRAFLLVQEGWGSRCFKPPPPAIDLALLWIGATHRKGRRPASRNAWVEAGQNSRISQSRASQKQSAKFVSASLTSMWILSEEHGGGGWRRRRCSSGGSNGAVKRERVLPLPEP